MSENESQQWATQSPMQSPEGLPEWAKGMRVDARNRILCTATNRSGDPCSSPAIKGARVCRMHGGAAPAARKRAALRLAELVSPAIATLAKEMTTAERPADRLKAANSILDRAGYGRVTKIEGSDAREQLVQRLNQLREQREADDQGELAVIDVDPDDYQED